MFARPSLVLGVLACVATVAPALGADAGPRSVPLTVEPARVEIGLLYGGVDLAVSAGIAPGVEVAVLVTGPPSELVLREQARRWGLFWAPAGEVRFDDVPSLYLLRTTTALEGLAPADVLEKCGYDVETQTDSQAAIDQLARARYDVLITDLKMSGPSGLDVLRFVKEQAPSTRVIVITGYATAEQARESMKGGAVDFIAKPFRISQLRELIARTLES